ncbi:hypothetical protein ACFWBH_26440 [Streptomyces sp. NPDC059999]|uniref:hypothetical protein n=1 Tax=Streptomyces sp. NPDC059999 TaxID=3347030 RepID=UPI0036A310E3
MHDVLGVDGVPADPVVVGDGEGSAVARLREAGQGEGGPGALPQRGLVRRSGLGREGPTIVESEAVPTLTPVVGLTSSKVPWVRPPRFAAVVTSVYGGFQTTPLERMMRENSQVPEIRPFSSMSCGR